MELTIGMTAEDAVKHFTAAKAEAEAAIANGTTEKPATFEYTIYGEANSRGAETVINFGNDDMERPEMAGRVLVDVDD